MIAPNYNFNDPDSPDYIDYVGHNKGHKQFLNTSRRKQMKNMMISTATLLILSGAVFGNAITIRKLHKEVNHNSQIATIKGQGQQIIGLNDKLIYMQKDNVILRSKIKALKATQVTLTNRESTLNNQVDLIEKINKIQEEINLIRSDK